MQRYILEIEATNKPLLLERVLRVIRLRGFAIKQVLATQNQSSGIAAIEIIVESDRPISLLTNQIEKLWDITAVHVSTLNRA